MRSALVQFWHYRELLGQWTLRILRLRYKQSLLGATWAFFVPFCTVLLLSVVARSKSFHIDTGEIPYTVFAYVGLVPWQFFQNALSMAVVSIINQKQLVGRIYFPRAILPLSAIGVCFVDMAFASLAVVGLFVYYSIPVTPVALLAIPILLLQLVFMVGCSLLLAMGSVFFRDVGFVFKMAIVVWMFGTAVIYPVELSNPLLQTVAELNPMTPILNSYRAVLIRGVLPDLDALLRVALMVLALAAGSVWIFLRLEPRIAEVI